MADWIRDFLRFRTFPLRNPLWRMRFPNDRLRAAGYRLRFGMAHAHAVALQTIQNEANHALDQHIVGSGNTGKGAAE